MEPNKLEITPELLEQNPGLAVAMTGMSVFVVTLLAGCLASWIYLVILARRGQAWLPGMPQRPRAWGLADLALTAVSVVLCQTVFAAGYIRWAGIDTAALQGKPLPAAVSAAASLGNVMALVLILGWLGLRFQVTPAHAGFHLRGWQRQLQMGVIATFATLPIVYLLMAAVTLGTQTAYKHPLLDEIRASATVSSYLLGVLTAVVLAPLAEEFLFRVLIQGWLQSWSMSSLQQILLGASPDQRLARAHLPTDSSTVGASAPASQPSDADIITADLADSSSHNAPQLGATPIAGVGLLSPSVTAAPPINPWGASTVHVPPGYIPATATALASPSATQQAPVPPLWPCLVSGVLFGLAHWGYGLSFIPLIILGIVLGLLYRASNSIWPSLIVHLSLNATSMLGLGLSILVERANLVALVAGVLGWR